jgi:hypothetical protein
MKTKPRRRGGAREWTPINANGKGHERQESNSALRFAGALRFSKIMKASILFTRLCSHSAALAVAALICSFGPGLKAAGHPDTTGWKPLFAVDFSNAIGGESWKWEDRVLVAKDHNTIWTKESYGNFILDLEFKVEKEANSGVFLRSGNIKDTLAALEIQVHESTDGGKYGMVGALYDSRPPSKSVAKPVGEWNHYTITCKDSLITLVFNGEEVLRADLNDWPEARKNPDGTPNKFKVALKDYARKGPLGLQGLHGKAQAPVWYRNLKIKLLD